MRLEQERRISSDLVPLDRARLGVKGTHMLDEGLSDLGR
jgi:hypothetical protein